MNRTLKIIVVIFFCMMAFIFKTHQKIEYVNVCNWYGMLPQNIIEQFEKETGIKIRYDVFDNNDVLEAKLLATNSGYDVVFPSLSPYVAHQLEVGVYQELDKKLIPNLDFIDAYYQDETQKIDRDLKYCVPYIVGTTGLIFDVDKLSKAGIDDATSLTLALLLDEKNAKKIAPFGISLLEENVDVFPMLFRFLKKDLNDHTNETLKDVYCHLLKIRPFIKRFSTDRTSNDLIMGEIALAAFWSGDAYRTIKEAKKVGRTLKYVIPKDGATLWIDVMAIPKGAPNKKNAHIFINFCLRPDIAAKISNQTYAVTSVTKSHALIDPELLKVDFLYPHPDILKTLKLDLPFLGKQGNLYDREKLRLWTKFRQFKKESFHAADYTTTQ
ncbi:MAG: Putrescine-binding periplasmic protein [Holosporales bacterium]